MIIINIQGHPSHLYKEGSGYYIDYQRTNNNFRRGNRNYIKKVTNISAILLIVAFFLPWISAGNSYMSVTMSGLKAAQLGGAAVIIWFIPLLSISGVILSNFTPF